MGTRNHVGSILVADCGTVMTRAMLLDRVQGKHRLLSWSEVPSTWSRPWNAVGDGVRGAVERISTITARRLLDENSDLITSDVTSQRGVDIFGCTVSASEPLTVTIGGMAGDVSLASARRAAAGTYSQVVAVLNDTSGLPLSKEACLQKVRDAPSDVILIAGGVEGGAERPITRVLEAVALACSTMDPEMRPTIVYAGNSRLRRGPAAIFGADTDLRMVRNIRPTLESEYLADAQSELQALFIERKMNQLPGFSPVTKWSPAPTVPTAHAFGKLVHYLWRRGAGKSGVLGVDVGGANTTIVAVFDDRLYLTVRADLGIALGGGPLLDRLGSRSVTRWHPEPVSADEARALLMNKSSFPASIPHVKRELWLEQALVREVIRTTLDVARQGWQPGIAQIYPDLLPLCDTIIVSGGGLAHAARSRETVLMVLDAVQPIGVSTLMVDTCGLTPALGSLTDQSPLTAAEAIDAGGLATLGTVIAPVGEAREGRPLMSVTVACDNGRKQDLEIRAGDLEFLPLPARQKALVQIRPRRTIDVGLGGPGAGTVLEVNGGRAGLVIDARGRPLILRSDPGRRRRQIQSWLGEADE